MHVVNLLAFGGVAFVTPEVVTVASHVRGDAVAVSTPYGAGWLLRVREDGVHEVGVPLSQLALVVAITTCLIPALCASRSQVQMKSFGGIAYLREGVDLTLLSQPTVATARA